MDFGEFPHTDYRVTPDNDTHTDNDTHPMSLPCLTRQSLYSRDYRVTPDNDTHTPDNDTHTDNDTHLMSLPCSTRQSLYDRHTQAKVHKKSPDKNPGNAGHQT